MEHKDGADRRLAPFLLTAGLASIPLIVQTVQTHWSGDVWLHAASILEFSQNPFDPSHPTIAAGAGHPDLSPYSMAWGLVDRVSGFGVLTVLVAAGLVNLVGLWCGLWMFTRRVTCARYAPALAVPAVLLMWGIGPWRWSGYPNLNSLGFGLPYPSFAALALALVALALLLDWLRTPRWSLAWAVAGLAAVTMLCHPITGVALGLGAATLVVEHSWRHGAAPRSLGQLVAPGMVAAGAVLAWPFYSFVSLSGQSSAYAEVHAAVIEGILPRALLGLACAPIAVVLARRRGDWRLIALALPPLLLVAVGVAFDVPVLGRLLPFGLLPLQLALAEAVARAVSSPPGPRRTARLAGGLAMALVGLVGSAAALSRMVPAAVLPEDLQVDERLMTVRDGSSAAGQLEDDMVLIAPELDTARLALVSGAKLVSPVYVEADVIDAEARHRAVDGFLDASTERQDRTVQAYDATHLVVSDGVGADLDVDRLGVVESSTDGLVVVRLR